MKRGDKVIVLVHGAYVTSEEYFYIERVNDKELKLEDFIDIFYKDNKGNYRTHTSFFGFWYEVKVK